MAREPIIIIVIIIVVIIIIILIQVDLVHGFPFVSGVFFFRESYE